jgi:hypothetical protein
LVFSIAFAKHLLINKSFANAMLKDKDFHGLILIFGNIYLQMLENTLKLVERQIPNYLDILPRRVLTNDWY